MELRDLGRSLQQQLSDSHDRIADGSLFKDNPDLLARLVSKLAYTVRDAPPRYIAVDSSQFDDQGTFHIAVYTDELLYILAYDPNVDHITTTVVGRASIKFIELLSAPNFMAGEAPGTSEGSLAVLASYETLQVKLPGDFRASERNRAQLDAFMVALFRDLARR